MSPDIPIWFLDIDGVLNTLPPIFQDKPHEFSTVIFEDLRISWRPKVIDFVNRVHREKLSEIHWLTMWGETAQTEFAPLVGLDHFNYAYDPLGDFGTPEYWWKISAIKQVTNGGRRKFIFTDDDLRDGLAWRLGNLATSARCP